jgi:hypothetical protein
MPDIQRTLQGNDLGFLKMVAGTWGIDLVAPDVHTALPLLVNALLNRSLVLEIIEGLPGEARHALEAVQQGEGVMPWAMFTRRFGEVRAMGAARRDRERPDLKPASPAEILWYRALIGKAFLGLTAEPQEYAYIPEDLLDLIGPLSESSQSPLGRPASPGETAHVIPASDRVLDHACTLLAALRMGMNVDALETSTWNIPARALRGLLYSAGLVDAQWMPIPEPARAFLEAPRGQALVELSRAWMDSQSFNELRMLPGLAFEGEWRNDPATARQSILDLLTHLPEDQWWSLPAFVSGVSERQPDFQRPAGDYDSWFIRRESDGTFLRGFHTWDEVDGALVRFLITGPLHWLGIFDLAAPSAGAAPTAFRHSGWGQALWHGSPPDLPKEVAQARASSEGLIRMPPLAPRAARYQIARFCQWETESPQEYRYRVTPGALERARAQGLRTSHLVSLLRKYASGPLPPNLLSALERWEKLGTQAHTERPILLRVSSADILAALAKTPAGRHLSETLNPTTAIIRPGGEDAVLRALAEMGYLPERKSE